MKCSVSTAQDVRIIVNIFDGSFYLNLYYLILAKKRDTINMPHPVGCPCPSTCHRTLIKTLPSGKADAKVHTFCKPAKYFNTFFQKFYYTLFIYSQTKLLALTFEAPSYVHLQPPRTYTCRLSGIARADSRGYKSRTLSSFEDMRQTSIAFAHFIPTAPSLHDSQSCCRHKVAPWAATCCQSCKSGQWRFVALENGYRYGW